MKIKEQFNDPFKTTSLLTATGFTKTSTVNMEDYSADDIECENEINGKGCSIFLFFITLIAVLIIAAVCKLI